MKRTFYTQEFKENSVSELLSANSPGLPSLADKLGVPVSTLYSWQVKYVKNDPMKKTKKNSKVAKYTSEKKLQLVIKTSSMKENELGEFLRKEGLHSVDLEQFKIDLISGDAGKGRPKLDPEILTLRKENKSLNRDLKRTRGALAEQSARIILLKKSHEIWGVLEGEE